MNKRFVDGMWAMFAWTSGWQLIHAWHANTLSGHVVGIASAAVGGLLFFDEVRRTRKERKKENAELEAELRQIKESK